jgi:hypothetical protein
MMERSLKDWVNFPSALNSRSKYSVCGCNKPQNKTPPFIIELVCLESYIENLILRAEYILTSNFCLLLHPASLRDIV